MRVPVRRLWSFWKCMRRQFTDGEWMHTLLPRFLANPFMLSACASKITQPRAKQPIDGNPRYALPEQSCLTCTACAELSSHPMAPILVEQPYAADDFTPLREHSTQTPTTFFPLTPVLHLQCQRAKLRLPKQVYSSQPVFSALQSQDSGEDAVIDNVGVWVTSRSVGPVF